MYNRSFQFPAAWPIGHMVYHSVAERCISNELGQAPPFHFQLSLCLHHALLVVVHSPDVVCGVKSRGHLTTNLSVVCTAGVLENTVS